MFTPTLSRLTVLKIGKWIRFIVLFAVGLTCIGYVSTEYVRSLDTPSIDFPTQTEIDISAGLSHLEIAKHLKEKKVVKSSMYLTMILKQKHTEEFIKAGTYIFDQPMTTLEVAEALINGNSLASTMKVTFPEGFSTKGFLSYLPEDKNYSTSRDISELEGYLFPDTYFISKDMTLDDILDMMQKNFNVRLSGYDKEIERLELTLSDLVILASIIEREAGDLESKRIISGILQRRLTISMPLQVDAVFDYLLSKVSGELTQDDLALDSPYNTYLYRGLPPGPISNPGIEALESVLYPTDTDYLYYLTDNDGVFHYAKTFEEHKRNKQLYLN